MRYSLELLPIDKVYDFGEPRPVGAQLTERDRLYLDGVIPDYISLLNQVGKTELANELAIEFMKQLETMMNYFQHSDALIAYNNKKDEISLSRNSLKTYGSVLDTSPHRDAAELATGLINTLINEVARGISK